MLDKIAKFTLVQKGLKKYIEDSFSESSEMPRKKVYAVAVGIKPVYLIHGHLVRKQLKDSKVRSLNLLTTVSRQRVG